MKYLVKFAVTALFVALVVSFLTGFITKAMGMEDASLIRAIFMGLTFAGLLIYMQRQGGIKS